MSWFLIVVLMALCAALLLDGLSRPGRFYEFPFLAAATFAFFIIPQVFGLANDRFQSDTALDKTLVFAILCLLACRAGWRPRISAVPRPNWVFSERRLLHAAMALSLIGAVFYFQLSRLPDEERLRTIHTGSAVMYLFFAKLLTYGFAIAVLCACRRLSLAAVLIILFDLVFIFDRVVIAGRRGETAEYVLIILLALWFQRGWSAPRTAVLAGIVLSFVTMTIAEDYRNAVYHKADPDWTTVLNLDIGAKVEKLLTEGGPEMRNAAHVIDRVDGLQRFDYGVSHWNWFVFTYVPAQIVGRGFKESLYIEPGTMVFARGYEAPVGSTSTGLSDAFSSFWYFGWVKFLLIAFLLSRIYSSSMSGNAGMQLLYMLTVTPAMHTITHVTHWLVTAWIHIAVFLIPVVLYAAVRAPSPRRSLAGWVRAGRLWAR